jgi:hypothetical protein
MARVDKTDSAIGVVRAVLGADLPTGDVDKVIAVGLNAAAGAVIKGASNSGIVGVMIPHPQLLKAGSRVDIFKIADIVECAGLKPGTTYFADNATGGLVESVAGAAPAGATRRVGHTVEADRLIITL